MDAKYFYHCTNNNLSISSYLIHTEATYLAEEYEKEVDRIKNTKYIVYLSAKGDSVTKAIFFSEELFTYPAYVAIYTSNHCYEYALLDEENRRIV